MPYDPLYPLICFDERPCFLTGDTGGIIPMSPGKVKRYRYEYEKNGSCAVLSAFDPHKGFRCTEAGERRTAADYARFMQNPVNLCHPGAQRIRPVQDNPNTHTPGSFYEVLPPQKAFGLSQRFETRFAPEKGSRLNMAETEFPALSKQCLNRRLPDAGTLRKEVLSRVDERNRERKTVNWKFTKNDAGEKLQRHYSELKKLI